MVVQGNGHYWHNLPHLWQAGWSTVQLVDGSVLGQGTTLQLTLTTLAVPTSATPGVRISADWSAGQDPLFLSYRVADPVLDPGLDPAYSGQTNIHSYAGTDTFSSFLTFFLAGVPTGKSWASSDGSLVVTQLSANATQVRGSRPRKKERRSIIVGVG